MVTATDPFVPWLAQAGLAADRLPPEQAALLRAAFRFRQRCGDDYYSTRLLSHFLLHCDSGIKVAQVARLLGVSRPTASRQQGLSSKQAIQQAHHRMDGRPYGKLLPRYAGPIAHFLLTHPDATRADLIDFIGHTFGVRVSRVAVYHFLKRFGLDHVPAHAPAAPAVPSAATPGALPAAALPAPALAPPFCSAARSTPAPSC
jgi:transposase